MMEEKMWTWSEYPDDYWENGAFDTREEAIEEAKRSTRPNREIAYIGECKYIPLCNNIDAEMILLYLDDQYRNDTGCDTYVYDGIDREDEEWLEAEMTKVIDRFHEKTKTVPICFEVENIEEIRIRRE